MPPPIATQSGSRAALVTWTVVSSILFVVMTVLAIFATVQSNKATAELATLQSRYGSVVSEADLGGDTVTMLTSAKAANPTAYPGTMSLLNVALTQRDTLARRIGGTASDADATAAAAAALNKVKAAPDKVPSDSLVSAVNGLLAANASQATQIQQLTEGREGLAKKLEQVSADAKTQLDAKQADIAKAVADADAARTQTESDRTTKDKQVADIQSQSEEQTKTTTDAINQLTAQQAEAQNKAKKLDDQIKALQSKLRDIRLPVDQIVRQADAHVMRVAGDNILYIDLGTGDGVVAGMSFEIYDRLQGVPKTGEATNDDSLPKGKASIELIKVSPGSSECRIVRQTPGETVVEGDSCVNLIFDKNIKYNVEVYGNFDLDRNGTATAQDADVIKRLVTRWGGKVVDKLNADTDFLVIGKLPELPNYTQEELDRPEIQFEVEKKKKEITEYDDILNKAIEYNIPVLNQNRFLYFTGYYEQAAR